MTSPAAVSLDIQIAVVRAEANEAASYAKACTVSRWPVPEAQLRADALRAALRTLEGVAAMQAHPLFFAIDPGPGSLDEVRT